MSRIGKQPIEVPGGVEVAITDGKVTVKGPKGELFAPLLSDVTVAQEDNNIIVTRKDDEKLAKSQHGLQRTLIANMVHGVTQGFSKVLEVNGVGFKINQSGKNLKLSLGYSHDIDFAAPEGIDIAVDGMKITVSGIDKQLVGQTAAEIRALRKPEPYKGKGIKYTDEYIVRKSGKAAGGKE